MIPTFDSVLITSAKIWWYWLRENLLNNSSQWPSVSIFDTKQFRQARIEAHNALFWMARGANSFLDATLNNGHLSLFWHRDSNNFRTRSFDGDLQIGLSIPELEIFFCENGEKVRHSFWFDDRTPAYVEAWYLVFHKIRFVSAKNPGGLGENALRRPEGIWEIAEAITCANCGVARVPVPAWHVYTRCVRCVRETARTRASVASTTLRRGLMMIIRLCTVFR